MVCLLIVVYACVAHQVALLPHVLSRVICYQVLCPAAAVLIGLLLSGVRQRYIVYPLMVIFGLSETEWLQSTTTHVMETTGKNYAKLMQIFSLIPNSMQYEPNDQIGIPWDLNKIAQLLFSSPSPLRWCALFVPAPRPNGGGSAGLGCCCQLCC